MTARLLLALLLLVVGCNVGQPLVGEKKGVPGGVRFNCGKPPDCDDPWTAGEPIDHPSAALQGCTRSRVCNGTSEDRGLGGCAREKVAELPQSAVCRELVLLTEDTRDATLEGVEWSEVNLTVGSETARSLTIRGGTLSRVHVQLEGPVTLRIESLDSLDDLRIDGAANGGGSPQLDLEMLQLASVLSVGSRDSPFRGMVRMHALHLRDIDLYADEANFESSLLEQASLRIETLTFTDVTLSRSLLEASNAVASAYRFQESVLHFCGDVRLIEGDITSSELRNCMGQPLRLFGCTFSTGLIDGSFELDDVNTSNARIGSRDSTRIQAYNSHFATTQLCDNLEQLALGIASDLRCSDCQGGNVDVCSLGGLEDPLIVNYCSAWADTEEPAACGGDLPTRPERLR